MRKEKEAVICGKDWQEAKPTDSNRFRFFAETVDPDAPVTSSGDTQVPSSDSPDALSDADKLNTWDYFERYKSLFGQSITPFNLGIYQTPSLKRSEDRDLLKATQYIGVMPLLKRDYCEKHGSYGVINVESRFGISPTEMIKVVLEGEDYEENPKMLKTHSFKEYEWREAGSGKWNFKDEKLLFGIVTGIGTIDLNQVEKGDDQGVNDFLHISEYSVFEIIDFVNKAKDVCRKALKKQSQRKEENLNCKIKGRVLVQKQIRTNAVRGQDHRFYCAYNKISEDIKENQIIKYALHLCKKTNLGDTLAEEINSCMVALAGVPLKKCTQSDFIGLKNNGAYRQYKDALAAAKKIILRFGVQYSHQGKKEGDGEKKVRYISHIVQPYFIDMNILFEFYCRALFKKAIKEINEDCKEKGNSLKLSLDEPNKKSPIFKVKNNYYMENYIPDIVVRYEMDIGQEVGEPDKGVAAVIDAKYSDVEQSDDGKKRERTHQILFYMKMLNCENGGLISPAEGEHETPFLNEVNTDGESLKKGETMLGYIPLRYPNPDDPDDKVEDGNESIIDKHIEIVKEYLSKVVNGKKVKNDKEGVDTSEEKTIGSLINKIEEEQKTMDILNYLKENIDLITEDKNNKPNKEKRKELKYMFKQNEG